MVSSRIGRNVFMDIDCENKFLEISRMPSYADIHKRASIVWHTIALSRIFYWVM